MKLSKFILFSFASLFLASCSNEYSVLGPEITPPTGGEAKTLTINIDRADLSLRSLDTHSQKDKYAPVTSLDIFIMNVDGSVIYLHDKVLPPSINNNNLGAPILKREYPNLSDDEIYVYVIANSDHDYSTVINMGQLKKSIYNFGDQNIVTNAGKVILQGECSSVLNPGTTTYYANVVLTPIVSRIEFTTIETKNNQLIKSFKVEAVYLDKYFDHMDLDFDGFNFMSHAKDDGTTTYEELKVLSGHFVTQLAQHSADNKVVITSNRVAAYNFFPAKNNAMPYILIRIGQITYNNNYPGPASGWLAVKKYHHNGSEFTSAKRGEVYTLSAIRFDVENLAVNPYAQSVKTEVGVTVKPWTGVGLEPEVDE